MNPWLLLATSLLALLGVAHSWLGERYILIRLFRRADLPHLFGSDVFTRHTLRFAWHITSITWWGMAATLCILGGGSVRNAVLTIAATSAACSLTALIGSRGRHLAWIVFAAAAIATWLGAP